MQPLSNYVCDRWVAPGDEGRPLFNAATGEEIARCSTAGIDFGEMLAHARAVGGPNLRKMTFHERGHLLKALALYLNERKEELYALNPATGATRKDGFVDIDGGIQTLFVISSKARREMPDKHVYIDGAVERTSRNGTFLGQHVCVPLKGAAVHINAFNFPCWGLLEKLAPTIAAGMPAIIKPATPTAFLAHRLFEMIIESGILPEGSVQFIAGSTGDLLERLALQDVVSFTGSAETARKIESAAGLRERGVRFNAETDSLNGAILGPDAEPGSAEFDLFVKEVVREMTVKAGQKCTAIRRAFVPERHLDAAIEALKGRLGKVTIGNPANDDVKMGALAGLDQRKDVRAGIAKLAAEAEIVHGDTENFELVDADAETGAFLPPVLLLCRDGHKSKAVHEIEAFGPVSTVIPYRDLEDAIALANKGEGSLVSSVFTRDGDVAARLVSEIAAYHGRLYIVNRDSAKEATGHGSPLPHLVHGGPGRAGGGEELGGVRGILHYMQRTAVQGSPDILTAVTGRFVTGARQITDRAHPFTRSFDELELGETLITPEREITLEDIEHFAGFTGDRFYAHMDEKAAAANPFFDGRVAHGYLLLSFAAGLFVEASPGPVLANYGLDNLTFMQPVYPGDTIKVRLTVKDKTARTADYGEVRWEVEILNEKDETCALYDLLTMNAKRAAMAKAAE